VVSSGAVKIVVGGSRPLAEAPDVHRALEARTTTGSTGLLVQVFPAGSPRREGGETGLLRAHTRAMEPYPPPRHSTKRDVGKTR
jgi:hypothetical protein